MNKIKFTATIFSLGLIILGVAKSTPARSECTSEILCEWFGTGENSIIPSQGTVYSHYGFGGCKARWIGKLSEDQSQMSKKALQLCNEDLNCGNSCGATPYSRFRLN